MIKSTLIKEDVTSNESSNNQNEVNPLTEDNQSNTYIVEKILARKKYQGSVLYKVKWKNEYRHKGNVSVNCYIRYKKGRK